MHFQNLKFQVENKEQAIALQEWLFEQGYKWDYDHDGKPKNINQKCITCYENGAIYFIDNNSFAFAFAEHKNTEMKLEFSNKLYVKIAAELIPPYKYIVVHINTQLPEATPSMEYWLFAQVCSFNEYPIRSNSNYTFDYGEAKLLQERLSEQFPENFYHIITIPNRRIK
jgi:hypothetical protein